MCRRSRELELTGVVEEALRVDKSRVSNGNLSNSNLPPPQSSSSSHLLSPPSSLFTLVLSCTIAAGVQQLSFLTPYIHVLLLFIFLYTPPPHTPVFISM